MQSMGEWGRWLGRTSEGTKSVNMSWIFIHRSPAHLSFTIARNQRSMTTCRREERRLQQHAAQRGRTCSLRRELTFAADAGAASAVAYGRRASACQRPRRRSARRRPAVPTRSPAGCLRRFRDRRVRRHRPRAARRRRRAAAGRRPHARYAWPRHCTSAGVRDAASSRRAGRRRPATCSLKSRSPRRPMPTLR